MLAHNALRPATTDADRYAYLIDRIERVVVLLNDDLGLSAVFDKDSSRTCVTFGYIGNLAVGAQPGSTGDDRSWSVFLPHPGRVGTNEDRIGSFRTGDLAGARATLNALVGFRRGLIWKRPSL